MKRAVILVWAVIAGIMINAASARADLAGPQKGRVALELVLWWPVVSGDATFNTEFIDGTSLDIQDIMGIDETATTIELVAWVNPLKRWRISFAWFMDKRTGNQTLDETVTVGGETFVVGGEVDSDIELQRYKLLNEIAIIRNDLGRVAVSVGVVYLDAIARIEGTATGGFQRTEGDRAQIPLPVVGAAAEIHIPKLLGFGAFIEGAGMGLSYKDVAASYIEFRGGLNWKSRFVFAQAGYQYLNLTAEAFDEVKVTLNLQGPFVSVGGKF